MFRRLTSIKYKLISVMLLIFIIFTFLVLSIWYSSLKREAEHTAVENMKTIINVSNTTFENQVKDVINITALSTVRSSNNLSTNIIHILSNKLLTDAEIIAYRQEARDYLISLCSFKKYLNGLMISDYSGNGVTYGITTPYDVIAENGWIDQADDYGTNTFFIEPHYSTKWYSNKNDLVFSVMRPVYDFSNHKVGFAIADINCQLFENSFDVNTSAQSSLYVINSETGKVLFTPKNDQLHLELQSYLADSLNSNLTDSSGDFFIDGDRGRLLVVYHRSDLTGWTTLSVIPEKEILAAFSNTLREIMYITVAICLVMIILVLIVSTLLTEDIVLLTNAVQTVDREHFELDIDIKGSDEVQKLYLQFQATLRQIKQLLTEIKESEESKRRAELSALQFQMNPHFLYNSLNTIRFLATIQGMDNIRNVSESLSFLMHTNMDGRAMLKIDEDILFVESYLKIQNYRCPSAFTYTIDCEDAARGLLIPKLFVQPLVENTVRHGLSPEKTNGFIHISYFISDGDLHVRVEDNGSGIKPEAMEEIQEDNQNKGGGHIGIRNIAERIRLYFGESYGLLIDSDPFVLTRFELVIPALTEEP